jgi:hypothetical protein
MAIYFYCIKKIKELNLHALVRYMTDGGEAVKEESNDFSTQG